MESRCSEEWIVLYLAIIPGTYDTLKTVASHHVFMFFLLRKKSVKTNVSRCKCGVENLWVSDLPGL